MRDTEKGEYQSHYLFQTNGSFVFHGRRLKPYKARLITKFRIVLVMAIILECILLAWPITATILWKFDAFLSWLHFIYAIRVALLIWAAFFIIHTYKLMGSGSSNLARIIAGFVPYQSIATWAAIALYLHMPLSAVGFVVALLLLPLFHGDLIVLWAISVFFFLITVVESIAIVWFVYQRGVLLPVMSAHKLAQSVDSHTHLTRRPRRLKFTTGRKKHNYQE